MRIYDGGSAEIDLRALAPEIVGQEHCNAARGVQKGATATQDLQDNIAILCMDEDDACDMILRDSGNNFAISACKAWRSAVNAKIVDSILRRSTRAAPILVAYFLLVPGLARSDSSANPPGSTRIDFGMPERLGRQVCSDTERALERPISADTRACSSQPSRHPSTAERYNLVELIDIAERVNPETRVAWEAARKAAIAVGLVESEYFPVLTLSALGGYQSEAFPAPKDVAPNGFFRATLNQVLPTLNLRWLLLDFGRRGNTWDAAKERLLAANLGFNRKHQEIIFNVQRAFLGLTSLRGKIGVAQSAVDSARAVRDRRKHNYATD